MSEHHGTEGGLQPPPKQAAQPPAPPPSSRPPVVRLQTWVLVVLLLTLFASCSAANSGDTVTEPGDVGAPSLEEVTDLCRLLGAVAQAEGVALDAVFAGSAPGQCQDAARSAAEGVRRATNAPPP